MTSSSDIQADLDGRAALLQDACQRALRYLAGLADRPVAPSIATIQREGTCWCGPTTWHGRTAMRISVSGWATTDDDIDKSIAAVRSAAARRPA